MQRIALDVQPKLTALSNDIALDPALFARVKAVYENPGWFLSKEDKRLLEKTYKSFARNGAALPADKQELYRQYTTELGEMTLKFGQNSLAATNAFTLNITDPGRVEELPDFVKEGLAADAKARGEKGLDGDVAVSELRPLHDLFVGPRGEGAAVAGVECACAGRRVRQLREYPPHRRSAPPDRRSAGI